MRTKIYFILGDLSANLIVGMITAYACSLLISAVWNPGVAMVVGMGVGMIIAGLLGGLWFFRYFGAMEIMLPTMLTGMMAGMGTAMAAAMGYSSRPMLLLGAAVGFMIWIAMSWLNRRLSGVQPLTE
jgi:hypothetical protein